MKYKDTDIAYLAGLIDGEGTISCSSQTLKTGQIALNKVLSIFNTNLVLISWITTRFGGVVHSRKRKTIWKEEHQVKWPVAEAVKILELTLPYLVIKREQAEIFLALHETKTGSVVSNELHEYRQRLVDRSQELNKRGCNKKTGED
jgi:hypothetical protein